MTQLTYCQEKFYERNDWFVSPTCAIRNNKPYVTVSYQRFWKVELEASFHLQSDVTKPTIILETQYFTRKEETLFHSLRLKQM